MSTWNTITIHLSPIDKARYEAEARWRGLTLEELFTVATARYIQTIDHTPRKKYHARSQHTETIESNS